MDTAGAARVPAMFLSNIMMDLPTVKTPVLPSVARYVEMREKPDITRVLTYLTLNIMNDIDKCNHH